MLYSNIILRQRDQQAAIFQQERDQLTAGFQQERTRMLSGFQDERGRMLAGFQGERERILASCKAERDVMLATFENERHFWKTQLDAANNAVDKSNALVEQSGNRLHEYLLRAPISNAPPVIGKLHSHPTWPGSVTKPANRIADPGGQLGEVDEPSWISRGPQTPR